MTTARGRGGGSGVGPQQPQGWVLFLALLAITAVGIAAVALIVNRAETPVSQERAVGQSALANGQSNTINYLLAHESAVGGTVGNTMMPSLPAVSRLQAIAATTTGVSRSGSASTTNWMPTHAGTVNSKRVIESRRWKVRSPSIMRASCRETVRPRPTDPGWVELA